MYGHNDKFTNIYNSLNFQDTRMNYIQSYFILKEKKSLHQQFCFGVRITIQAEIIKVRNIPLALLYIVQHFNNFWSLCY